MNKGVDLTVKVFPSLIWNQWRRGGDEGRALVNPYTPCPEIETPTKRGGFKDKVT